MKKKKALIGASVASPRTTYVDSSGKTVEGRTRMRKVVKPKGTTPGWGDRDPNSSEVDDTQEGVLQPIAAHVLMKVLYGACMVRFDLLRAVCHLACYVTKWTAVCDRRLHRLMSYIHHSVTNSCTAG